VIVPPTGENIKRAARILRSGGLVAFPTETVYGLGANALDPDAVRKIFAAKGRPQDNPLILHISNAPDARRYAVVTPLADALMRRFWPGPLTIVLEALDVVPDITRACLATVALRMPSNDAALALIAETSLPIAGPSANRSGRPSPTTAQAVRDDLGGAVDMIIDGGPASIGVESTVVDATGTSPAILRPGGVTREMLRQVASVDDDPDDDMKHRSPGTRHRHYAPLIPVLLWAGCDRGIFTEHEGTKWCYVGMKPPPQGSLKTAVFDSIEDYARGLFAALRDLESAGGELIIAELPEDSGLGSAVRNRLTRAAGIEQR
jgi:L-threonylcarbamoyladenylate synthase